MKAFHYFSMSYKSVLHLKLCFSHAKSEIQLKLLISWSISHSTQTPSMLDGLGDAKKKYIYSLKSYWLLFTTFTGCSLSDQHILSPINPKCNDRFCQIYEDLHKLFWNSNFTTFWVNWWQNMLISDKELIAVFINQILNFRHFNICFKTDLPGLNAN